MTFDAAVADFPDWAINERAPNVTYTPWHLIEHLRITQWDMLRYIEDPADARFARMADAVLAGPLGADRCRRLPAGRSRAFGPT